MVCLPQQSFFALVLFVLGFLALWGFAYFLLRRQERHAMRIGQVEEDDLSSSLVWEQGKREQKAVKSAIGVMSSALDEAHLFREVCEAISRGFHFSHVWLEMRTNTREITAPACYPHSFARDHHAVVPQLTKAFVASNLTKTYKNIDQAQDVALAPLQSRGLAFVAGIPLGHAGKAWGVLYLGDAAHREVYHATIGSVQVVADHLALVAERLRGERAIERQGQLVRTLMKSTPDAVMVVNEHGKVVQTNAAFDSLFGLAQGESEGHLLGEYIRSKDTPEHEDALIDRLCEQGSTMQTSRNKWLGRDGEDLFPLRLAVGEFNPDGEGSHWILWLSDISEQLDREQALSEVRTTQENSRAAEGRLLSKISHALRTPLESIIASNGLLTETGLDQEQREYVENMRDGVDDMAISLGDALDIMESRIRNIILRQDPFTLHTMLEDLVERFYRRARKQGIAFYMHIDPDVPSAIVGDVVHLRQVLARMLEDALQRTRKGQVYFRITEESRSLEGHSLCFSITNTGEAPQALWAAPIKSLQMLDDHFAEASVGVLNSLHLVDAMAGTTLASATADGGKLALRLTLPSGEPTSSDHLRFFDNLHATLWGHDDFESMILQDVLREYGIESSVFDNLNEALDHLRENSGNNNGQLFIVPFNEQQSLLQDLLTYFVEDTLLSGVNLVLVTRRSDRAMVTELFSHGRIFCLPYPYRRRALGQILTSCSGQIEAGESGHGVVGRFAAPLEQRSRVLYIEDNGINRQVCRRLLERWGFQCQVVDSGAAAIELLAKGATFDLILLDCVMPDIDGFTTALTIRAQEEADVRTPIIGMSQQESGPYQQRCKNAGMDALLLKPLTPTALYRALHKFLGQKQS